MERISSSLFMLALVLYYIPKFLKYSYKLVKRWYKLKVWNLSRVHDAVEMELITAEEFKEITGKEYK